MDRDGGRGRGGEGVIGRVEEREGVERKRNRETKNGMEGEGGRGGERERDRGREIEGVERKRNRETEEGMEGD